MVMKTIGCVLIGLGVLFFIAFLGLLVSEHHREDKWYKRHDGYLG